MRFNEQLKNEHELLSFLLETEELNDWETTFILMKSNIGMEISASTKIGDPSGLTEYTTWRDAKTLALNFLSIYSSIGAYIDIRLRAPKRIKDKIDKNDSFVQLSFSFYAERGNIMAQNTALERNLPAEITPLINWDNYTINLINSWKVK